MAAISSAILVIGCREKPVFKLKQKVDGSNPCLKFGINPIKMSELVTMDRQTDKLKTIERRQRWRTKLVFELEQEFDGSNQYMNFRKNQIKND